VNRGALAGRTTPAAMGTAEFWCLRGCCHRVKDIRVAGATTSATTHAARHSISEPKIHELLKFYDLKVDDGG
jgi:hypothetical protein